MGFGRKDANLGIFVSDMAMNLKNLGVGFMISCPTVLFFCHFIPVFQSCWPIERDHHDDVVFDMAALCQFSARLRYSTLKISERNKKKDLDSDTKRRTTGLQKRIANGLAVFWQCSTH